MLLWLFLWLIFGLALLGLAAWRVIRGHRQQPAAVVLLGPGLGCQQLEGALRRLGRQRGRFRRVYICDAQPGGLACYIERRRQLGLLCQELGFCLLAPTELGRIQKQGLRLYYLDAAGRLHEYRR